MKPSPNENLLTAEVCVATLKTCSWLGIVSLALLIGAIAGAILVPHLRVLWALSAAAGFVALYYHVRLVFDRRLFSILAQPGTNDADFDAALGLVLGTKEKRTERTLADRWNGTRRLLRRFMLSLIVQFTVLVAALII